MGKDSRIWNAVLAVVLALSTGLGTPGPVRAADITLTVTSLSPDWVVVNENGTSGDWSAGFENGPPAAPAGRGSAYVLLSSAGAAVLLGTQKYQGIALSAIEVLSYSTYTDLPPRSLKFEINYDPDLSTGVADPDYGRLIYEPALNGTVADHSWQTWDMIAVGDAKWWATPNPDSSVDDACPRSAPCTWAGLIAAFPNIGIRDDLLSGIMFEAGPDADGLDANVDNLRVQIGGNADIYDFEPLTTTYVDASWSGVTPGTDPDGAGPAVKFGADSFAILQEGIDAVAGAGTVYAAAGSYPENIIINKRLSLIGAGSGSTILTNPPGSDPASAVVQIAASGGSDLKPLLLKDLGIHPAGLAGIGVGRFNQSSGESVEYLALENIEVLGTNTEPCSVQERGLYVDRTSSLQHLSVKNSSFSNLTFGWYFHKALTAEPSTVRYVSVQNTFFNHNNLKGIYAEKLSDAAFTDVTADGNGFSTASDLAGCPGLLADQAGIDLDLRAGSYQDISFVRPAVTNNGLGGAKEGVGLALRARDGKTYSTTLENVQITGGAFTGNERGIRVGVPGTINAGPSNVAIHRSSISGNVQTYGGSDGSPYGGVVNLAAPPVDATYNWWGNPSGPGPVGPGTGDGVSANVAYEPWCINSLCLNDPPVITEGSVVRVNMSENAAPIPFRLILHATDANWGDTLTWSIAAPAVHGTAAVSGSGASARVSYSPDVDFHAVDSFTVLVSDGQGGSDTITVHPVVNRTRTINSSASMDGWIRESSETSGVGGMLDYAGNVIILGDDTFNRQYRGILSFNTDNLPDEAVITSATLRIRRASLLGTDPFSTHGRLAVDIRKARFGNYSFLELIDFQAPASRGPAFFILNAPAAGWYSARLPAGSLPYITKIAATQLRLRFQLDDDNDGVADQLRFYSGNSALGQPELIVRYHLP